MGDFHADIIIYMDASLTCLGFSIPNWAWVSALLFQFISLWHHLLFQSTCNHISILWASALVPPVCHLLIYTDSLNCVTCFNTLCMQKVTTTSSFSCTHSYIFENFTLHLPCPQGWQCLGWHIFHDTYSVQSSHSHLDSKYIISSPNAKRWACGVMSWCQVNPGNPPGCLVVWSALPWTHNALGYTLDNSHFIPLILIYNPSSHFVSFTLSTGTNPDTPQFLCGLHFSPHQTHLSNAIPLWHC